MSDPISKQINNAEAKGKGEQLTPETPPPVVPAGGNPTPPPVSTPTPSANLSEQTNNIQSDKVINDLSVTLRGLNTRQLPTWDHNTKKRESIKEHLQMAKQLGRRLEWSDKELANEVMLSLRGESRSAARNFPDRIQNSFKLLEKELEKFFWVPKPKSQMMKEFNNLSWNDERQTLQQYGVTLRSKLMKIFRGDTEEFNLKLRDRFIEGIKEVRPEFGRSFEMLDLDSKTDFMELASYAQSKYDIYRINSERIEEDQAFLTKEFNAEKKKGKANEQKRNSEVDKPRWENRPQPPKNFDYQHKGNKTDISWKPHPHGFQDHGQGPMVGLSYYHQNPPVMTPGSCYNQTMPDFVQKPVNWHFREQHWGRRPTQFGYNEWRNQRYNSRYNRSQDRDNGPQWRNGYNWGDDRTAQYPYFNPGFQRNEQQRQYGGRRNSDNFRDYRRPRNEQTIQGSMVKKHDKTEYLESQENSKNL